MKQSPLANWIPAVVIAVAWHAIWWLGVAPRHTSPAVQPPSPTRLIYLPVSAGGQGGALRSLWSPALFSLPTSVGFSGSVLSESAGIRPPVDPRMRTEVLMDRALLVQQVLTAVPTEGLQPNDRLQGLPASAEVPDLLPDFPGRGEASLMIYGDTMRGRPVSPPLENLGHDPWETEVELIVHEKGWVQHVVCFPPPPDPKTARALTTSLYAWHPGPGTETRLRLHYVYRPAAEPVSLPSEVRAP